MIVLPWNYSVRGRSTRFLQHLQREEYKIMHGTKYINTTYKSFPSLFLFTERDGHALVFGNIQHTSRVMIIYLSLNIYMLNLKAKVTY